MAWGYFACSKSGLFAVFVSVVYLKWTCNQNSNIFIKENLFENVVCEKSALLC